MPKSSESPYRLVARDARPVLDGARDGARVATIDQPATALVVADHGTRALATRSPWTCARCFSSSCPCSAAPWAR